MQENLKALTRKVSHRKNRRYEDQSNLSQHKHQNNRAIENAKKRRLSGASHSNSKWNNRSVEQDLSAIKTRLAENRKKYNLSCGDMIDRKSRSKSRSKDKKKINKKKSTLNTTKIHNLLDTAKQQGNKKKKDDKSKTKFKKVSISGITKSKGSTTMISKPNLKKKEGKDKKDKKKKSNKSKDKNTKSHKGYPQFIFSKEGSEEEPQI